MIGFHILCDSLSIIESLDLRFLKTLTPCTETSGEEHEPGVRAGYHGPVVSAGTPGAQAGQKNWVYGLSVATMGTRRK